MRGSGSLKTSPRPLWDATHTRCAVRESVSTEDLFQSRPLPTDSLGRETATTRCWLSQLHNLTPFNSSCYLVLTLTGTLEYHPLQAGASQEDGLTARWKWDYSTIVAVTILQLHKAQSRVTNSYHKASRDAFPGKAGYLTKVPFLKVTQETSPLLFAEISIPDSLGVFIALPYTLHGQHSWNV